MLNPATPSNESSHPGSLHQARAPKVHDPLQYRAESLLWSDTPGAVAVENVLSLSQLKAIIDSYPGCTVVVSDIHGYIDLLRNTLLGLGLITPSDERILGPVKLVGIGDAVDGRRATDFETAKLVRSVFDLLVGGNHDVAHLGGPSFEGMVGQRPEVSLELKRMAQSGQLVAALAVGDILLTHAGVHSDLFNDTLDPQEIADRLNNEWFDFLRNSKNQSELLFEVSAYRIENEERKARAPLGGGVLWEDWRNLVDHHPTNFRQIVGHTNVGRPERSKSGLVYAIDVAGYRLGIAVITPSGEIHIGSDYTT